MRRRSVQDRASCATCCLDFPALRCHTRRRRAHPRLIDVKDPGSQVLLLLERDGRLSGAHIGRIVWPMAKARGNNARTASRKLHALVRQGLILHDARAGLYGIAFAGREALREMRTARRTKVPA